MWKCCGGFCIYWYGEDIVIYYWFWVDFEGYWVYLIGYVDVGDGGGVIEIVIVEG